MTLPRVISTGIWLITLLHVPDIQHPRTPSAAGRIDSSFVGLSHHWPDELVRSLDQRPGGTHPGGRWPVFSPWQPIQAHGLREGCGSLCLQGS